MTDQHAMTALGVILGYLAGMLVTLCVMGDVRFKGQIWLVAGLLVGVLVGLIL